MTPFRLFYLTVMGSLLLTAILGGNIQAETWTDRTGQYNIEAEYVGVEGANVVLRKSDGTSVKVPIERLSAESRERAKQLYQAAQAKSPIASSIRTAPVVSGLEATVEPTTPHAPTINPVAGATVGSNFTPPVPPAVPPMPPFPADASLQDTVDFVRVQILSGHPEVLWYATPERLRSALDSSEYRSGVASLRQQSTTNEAVMTMLMKAFARADVAGQHTTRI